MSTFPRDHIQEALELEPVEQAIYLSMMGPEAWRMYRSTGAQASLVLPMFAHPEHFIRFVEGVYEVVAKCALSAEFRNLAVLDAYVLDQVRPLSLADRKMFESMDRLMDPRVLGEVYGVSPDDVRLNRVNRLGSFMWDRLYRDTGDFPAPFTDALASVWFAMCDAALTVDTDVSAVYADVLAALN